MSPAGPGPGDRGAGTVLVVAVIGFAGLLIAVTLLTGRAVQARHRGQAAADLAALAAAAVLEEASGGAGAGTGAGACATAATVAELNGARLAGCRTTADGDVTVAVRIVLDIGPTSTLPAFDGNARAGPVSLERR